MTLSSSLTRSLLSLLAAAGVLSSVACGGITTEQDERDLQGKGNLTAGPGTDGPVDGSTVHPTPGQPADPDAPSDRPVDPPSEPVTLAQAHTRAQLETIWAADDEGGGTGGGPTQPLDPNDLFLEIADVGVQCSSSYVALPCGGHWSASIGLPPSLQKVGVYDLSSPELTQYSFMSESSKEPNSPAPDDCGWGGGSFGGGTLEILAIDDKQVTFKLTSAHSFFESDPSGTYTALRCK